ncbi:MAG TPA: carbonate dehydratase [Chiayiivirga sp.]|nr:carbonate dehydratase [Chiayiivirga sp.]
MSEIRELFERNHAWAQRIERDDPGFFHRLSRQQAPGFLWIGCSDSRVPSTQIVDIDPGSIFVHRNVSNVVVHTDFNALSSIQFAVDALKVRHIMVVGHYGCGGVGAALRGDRMGLIDNWLRHVADVAATHRERLDESLPFAVRHDRLCELNAIEQAMHVCATNIVRDAWARGQNLRVHAWIYGLSDGHLRDLGLDIAGLDEAEDRYREALANLAVRWAEEEPAD